MAAFSSHLFLDLFYRNVKDARSMSLPLVPPPHLLPGSATYRHLEVDDGHEDIQRAVELHRVDAVADVGFDQV